MKFFGYFLMFFIDEEDSKLSKKIFINMIKVNYCLWGISFGMFL